VQPWSAVRGLVFGYDGSDSGTNYLGASWFKSPTSLRSVRNLQAATHLEAFAAAFTPLVAVDAHGMRRLQVVDCFGANAIASANLTGCTGLLRLCFEASSLTTLDTRTLDSLEDIRCAVQSGGAMNVLRSPNTWQHLWHLCVRDQSVTGIDDVISGALSLPAMAELYLWGDHSHALRALRPTIPNNTCREIQAYDARFNALDLSAVTWAPGSGRLLWMRNNSLQTVNLGSAAPATSIDLQWCGMPSATVDSVLAQVNAFGTSGGGMQLQGNGVPSAAGLASRDALVARGWSVQVAT
jgi:hypothetical protein